MPTPADPCTRGGIGAALNDQMDARHAVAKERNKRASNSVQVENTTTYGVSGKL